MPKFVERGSNTLLVGPGLDHLLEPKKGVILIDDYFSDVYSDLVFQGYNIFVTPVEPSKPDLVGAHLVATILSRGSSILVCGFRPDHCLLAFSAHLILFEGKEVESALKETVELLSKIYENVEIPYQIESALKTLERLHKLLGLDQLNALFAVAQNYDFGKDRFRYADRLSWLHELGAKDEDLLAASFYFLVEGHGKPEELFQLRLDALGKENVVNMIGEEALNTLELIARGDKPKLFEFVDSLEPGDAGVQYIHKEGNELRVKCLVGSACMSAIERAKRLLPLETPQGVIEKITTF